jgi:hypothetical protein
MPPPAELSLALTGARLAAGVLHLRRVVTSVWGGRVVARGRVDLRSRATGGKLPLPVFDGVLQADRIAVGALLGTGLVRGRASFRARVRGPLHDLIVDVQIPPGENVTVLEESFQLPTRLALRFGEKGLHLPHLHLAGAHDSELMAAGRIGPTGRLALAVDVQGYRFERLPGMAQTALPLMGRLSGQLFLSGTPERPGLEGELTLDPVTFQGRPVGGGAMVITPGPRGAVHARGTLAEGILAEGTLMPGPDGLRGTARLDLQHLRLDPFFMALPEPIEAVGEVSGTIVVGIAPGRAASAEGRLTELAITVTGPASAAGSRAPPAAFELRSDGDVPFAALSGDGPLRIGPTRVVGSAGDLELMGETAADRMQGSVRGRLDLDKLAAVLAIWFDHLSGAVDVDLQASRASAAADRPLVTGDLSVARSLAFRVPAVPVTVRIPRGRIHVSGNALDTRALPIEIDGSRVEISGGVALPDGGAPRLALNLEGDLDMRTAHRLTPRTIARGQGAAHLRAQLHGTAHQPVLHARLELDPMQLDLQEAPLGWWRIGGGTVIVDEGRPGATFMDLPLRGEVRSLETSRGRVDAARFAVRLRGDPRRSLILSGDAQIIAARVQAASVSGTDGGASTGYRPTAARTELDLRLTSHGGAVVLEVPRAPDLRVDVDLGIRGPPQHPKVSGVIHPANLYSRVALWLRGLFR